MILLYLIIIVIVCIVVLYKKLYKKDYWKNRNIVETGEILGKFIFSDKSLPELLKNVYDEIEAPVIGLYLCAKPTLLLKNAEDIQAVLTSDFQSFYSRGATYNCNDTLADNLLITNDYPKWKLLRQKLSPVFANMNVRNMHYIIEKCAHDFVEFVEDNPHLRKKPFNLIYNCTIASIASSVFGIDTKTKNTMNSRFLDMAWKFTVRSTYLNIISCLSNAFPGLYKIFGFNHFKNHEDFFVDILKNAIDIRRNEENSEKRHDFIEFCLEIQNHGVMQDFNTGYELYPSVEVLAAQAFSFFIGGADNNANTIHFTLTELSNNPYILKKLHEEIDRVFGKCKDVLSYKDIEKMEYLDTVISESMRKYPPIGTIKRICTRDTVLPSGVKVLKDTAILLPIYALHRDEKLFPNPEIFDPERFAPENVRNIRKYSYMPFGGGHRVCIGARYAHLSVKTVLAWLLRRFTVVEQNITPKFEKHLFAIRSPDTTYELKLRGI